VNPYLKRLRDNYTALQTSCEALQARAAKENRDLTADELRSVTEQTEQAKALYTQIEMLTEAETRTASVAQLAAKVADATAGGEATTGTGFTTVGGATTTARDPGHYRSVGDGGRQSFFRDLYRSKFYGDDAASRRLVEHTRALNTTDDGTGIVPPKWLVDEYAELARQGRALASAVRNIPLGDDPRPMTLPKQTGGTDSVVAEQTSENDSVSDTDAFDTDVDTVVPKPTSGAQKVSRQLLDMSSPAIDLLIYGDLIGAYNDKVEVKVCAAIQSLGSALTGVDSGDVTDPDHYDRVAIQAAVAVRRGRKRPPNVYAMSVGMFGNILDLRDTMGRPLVPDGSDGPVNVAGIGSIQSSGRWHSLGMIPTDGFLDTGAPIDDAYWCIHLPSILLFESNMLRFRYEEPEGPQTIRMGIWAYTAVAVRYGTTPVKRVEITPGS
jgi:HK97 family phage major capsid protein